MSASMPTISVVVPLYNKAAYVEQAVRSALLQQPRIFELVVVDDGSTDDGAARVASVTDERLILLRQSNAGVSAARNRGIAHAKGDLVAFLDADDWYRPGFIAAVHRMVERYPQAAFYATGYDRVINCEQADCDTSQAGWKEHQLHLIDDFYRKWVHLPLFSSSSVSVRRRYLMEHHIRFPLGETLGEDQDVWFRLAEKGPVAFCPAALSAYRIGVHDSATSRKRPVDVLPCYQRLSQRLANGQVPPHLRSGARRLLASHLLNVARARAAMGRKAEARAMVLDPRAFWNPLYWARSVASVWLA